MEESDYYAFAGFRFSARRRELTRSGSPIVLGSRANDLLAILLRHAGQTVSKEALMAGVWPDRVVEENNLTVQLSALRRALGETTGGERFIHTEPGRGYRFIAAVSEGDSPAAAPAVPATPTAERLPAGKPSIAALPFDNMSGDPEQTWFADGMVEDIITELSRFRSLFVVARNSSFSYRGQARDIRTVGAELGVRYVLEGSVRGNTSRVRVTAQLIDAETGGHVWAERYDRDIADMFAVQDEITRAVVGAIEPALLDAERQRVGRMPPGNLDAWEACHRGMWLLDRIEPEATAAAREWFERAIALDPRFAAPHGGLVTAYHHESYYHRSREHADAMAHGRRHAARALELDPNDAASFTAAAWAAHLSRDHAGTVARADQAIALNPNYVDAHRARTLGLVWLERVADAHEAALLALRLNPRGSRAWITLQGLVAICYLSGDYQAAIDFGLKAMNMRPVEVVHRWLAAAYGQLGRIEEAQALMRRPGLFNGMPFDEYARSRAPRHAHLMQGLRLAGWTG